ncbi:MAG: acetate kinase [Bacteroidales bacterium]|nr:acetate kinase [Bacteroidales bacterium]MBN2757641.1 acetate kinase [Bacteroidales bacterium]
MNIMVLNCGSSSIKYQLFKMEEERVLAKGIVEKIGLKGAYLMHEKEDGQKVKFEGDILDHQVGIEYVLGILVSKDHGCIADLDEINAVGHRVAHGGEKFTESVLIDADVKKDIEKVSELAPLHNPHNYKGILAMDLLLPNIPQVAVFDTAFHQTMPAKAFMYATPYTLYKKHGVRRYGFHGTSYRYIINKAAEMLNANINEQKVVACHLGNGASITAIKNGKSVDTSMGLTPVEGLIMGTRTGDLDLGVLLYLMEKEEIGIDASRTLINKHSGMLGITGVSSDMREIEIAAEQGNERAQLGLDMYYYRIKKYIGAYAAAMGGIDTLIFTGGIGENADIIRRGITEDLEFLGIELDYDKNKGLRKKSEIINSKKSKVNILVIQTDEEYVIAKDTEKIINNI